MSSEVQDSPRALCPACQHSWDAGPGDCPECGPGHPLVQARPDTSALPYETQVRLLVAEAQGATWSYIDGKAAPGWALKDEINEVFFAADDGEVYLSDRLPNPLTDPAAWGALMEGERIALCAPLPGRSDFNLWDAWIGNGPTSSAATTRAACALAYLASRGITAPPKEDA